MRWRWNRWAVDEPRHGARWIKAVKTTFETTLTLKSRSPRAALEISLVDSNSRVGWPSCDGSFLGSRDKKGQKFLELLRPTWNIAPPLECLRNWRNLMKSTTIISISRWPMDLEHLGAWLEAQGVDLNIPRTESALLELTRLIGHLRFSKKMRCQPVRWRLLLAQDRLCFPKHVLVRRPSRQVPQRTAK